MRFVMTATPPLTMLNWPILPVTPASVMYFDSSMYFSYSAPPPVTIVRMMGTPAALVSSPPISTPSVAPPRPPATATTFSTLSPRGFSSFR